MLRSDPSPTSPRTDTPRIGLAYSAAAASLVHQLIDEVDYVEFPFELLVRDDVARSLAREVSAVLHCASLSLASHRVVPADLLMSVVAVADEIESPWIGEHLALISASAPWMEGHLQGEQVFDVGFAISPPMTTDTIEVVVRALRDVADRTDRPLLLENGPLYLPMPGSSMSQSELMSQIVERSGAGVLLDLAHLLITCHTLDLDPVAEVGRMPLDRVYEIHLSGMTDEAGVLWDDHSMCPPAIEYELLRLVLERAPVQAITHEYNWSPVVDVDVVRAEIARTRQLADHRNRAAH